MPTPDIVRMSELRDTIQAKAKGLDEWIAFLEEEIRSKTLSGAATEELEGLRAKQAAIKVAKQKLEAMDVFVPFLCCDQFMNCPPGN